MVPSAENSELSNTLKSGVGQNIIFHAPPAVRKCALLISAVPNHRFSPLPSTPTPANPRQAKSDVCYKGTKINQTCTHDMINCVSP